MGMMIVAGFAALFVVIAGRLPHPPPATPPANPTAATAIELPAGAHIESMSLGADRLAVEMVLSSGDRQIVIVDLASGRTLRTIPVRTAP